MRKSTAVLLIVMVVPLLLANKGCERSTTWGKQYFGKWEEDHVDIDVETRCVDCHDDIKSQKVRPKNHDDPTWIREHGSLTRQKYGFRGGNVCILCHTEVQCALCHQQEEPQNHTEYWRLKGHGVMVGLDRSACMTCHSTTDFCERCHALTTPQNHTAAWGSPSNRHCGTNCHLPLATGTETCGTCHPGTPSHDSAPPQPSNELHVTDTPCELCHTQLPHPDNGTACASCHTR